METQNSGRSYWESQLSGLVGKRVQRAYMSDSDWLEDPTDEGVPTLLFDDGTSLFIVQDEEANGPGRFVLEVDPKHGTTQ